MKKSTINFVTVYSNTTQANFEVHVYYHTGRVRKYYVNEISELPTTVQNVIIGCENTIVTETYTEFYPNDTPQTEIEMATRIACEFHSTVIVNGVDVTVRKAIKMYIERFENIMFRTIRENGKVSCRVSFDNPNGNRFYSYVSGNSLLGRAIVKYESILEKYNLVDKIIRA